MTISHKIKELIKRELGMCASVTVETTDAATIKFENVVSIGTSYRGSLYIEECIKLLNNADYDRDFKMTKLQLNVVAKISIIL